MIGSTARFLFKYRSYTPIPLVPLLAILTKSTEAYFLAGAAIAALGEGVRIWALRHAGPKTRSHRKIRVDSLIVSGPYSIVRNPLYIGNFILSLGIGVATGRPVLILPLVIVFVLQYAFIIRAEEEFLAQALGEVYRDYRERVPRIIPSPGIYKAGDRRFPFREILPRELNTITAAETVLAIVGWPILFSG